MPGDESMHLPLPWQQAQWQRLQARRDDDRLPHALLFHGPAGTGKSAFANHLARSLVCAAPAPLGQPCGHCHDCTTSLAGNHPDLIHVEPPEPGKAIRVDVVRELIRRSVLTAQGGGYRVFVVEPADALNAAAANALLKTLEEPVPGTLFILLTARPDRLPATIRSRCQQFSFPTPEPSLLREWIAPRQQGVDIRALADWCGNAPLVMLETEEANGLGDALELLDALLKLRKRQANPVALAETWKGRDGTGVLADLGKIVADMLRVGADARAQPRFLASSADTLQSLVEGIDLQDLYHFQDRLLALQRGLSRNLNMGMLLQQIVIDWLRLTRPGAR